MEFYYHEARGDVVVIAADGGINKETGGQFVAEIKELVKGGVSKLLIDCENLKVLSSYGLSGLLTIYKRAREAGGEVKLANVHSIVVQVLTLVRLNKVFEIYPDIRAALEAFPEEGK